MHGMNHYFTNSIYEWLQNSINKTDFFDLLPIFEGKEKNIINKKADYEKIFSNVQDPPQNILLNQNGILNTSQLINFIQFLFNNNYRNNIFCYFVHFLPKDQMTYFLSKNITVSTIPEADLNTILPKLPFCDYVVIIHSQRLQNQSTFLISIAFIFRYYEQLSIEIEKYVLKSFHKALEKGIGSNLFHEILSILFATESGPKTFNFFFSTIQESTSILVNYMKSNDLNSLFSTFPEREDLPLSFMNFLVNANINFYYLSESMIIQYVIQCSELFFRYISQITDEFEMNRIWRVLLNSIEILSSFSKAAIAFSNRKKSDLIKSGWNYILNLSNSMRVQVVHNILHSYLFFIERFKSISLICNDRTFQTWMLTFLPLNFEKICTLDNYLSVMMNIFLISRTNETIAVLISDILSLSDYFSKVLIGSYDIEKKRFNTKIIDALLFILFPFDQYIFNDLFPQISNFNTLNFCSSPCNTFCKQIAASILAVLLDIKIPNLGFEKNVIDRQVFDDIIRFLVKMSNRVQFQKVCSFLFDCEDFLLKIAHLTFCEENPKKIINKLYYDFIISCLSFSCNFNVFYYVYTCIESDIEKTVNFLRILAEKTPIVNSFIFPTESFDVKMPLIQMTTVLWFRVMNSQMTINQQEKFTSESSNSILSQYPTKIVSIQVFNPNENTLTLMLNRETLYIIEENTNKIVGKVQYKSNIENWNFLTISIDSKSIDVSFNLQQISIKFNSNISNSDFMTIHPFLDIQLFRIYKKNLKWSQILRIFAIGPNSKDYLVDDFASIIQSEPISISPSSPNNYSTYFSASQTNIFHLFSNCGYISYLYIDFHEHFDNDNDNYLNSFSSTVHFSISPPYEIIKAGRDKIEIDKKSVWSFNTFFNSLDSIGGINLIIHLVAEVLVKYSKYQNETLHLLSVLLNRFPFIHDFFVDNSIYDLFSCLVDSHLNFQSLFLYDNKLIINSKIIQCFLSKNRPSQSVIQNLVGSFNLSSGVHNNKFLNTTQLYNMIIMTLKDFNDVKMIEMLCEFALNLTVKTNLNDHSTFAFICLLYNHFNYDNFIKDKFIEKENKSTFSVDNWSTVHLLKLCSKLLPSQNIYIETLIPVLLNDNLIDTIKLEILTLLLNNTAINFYEYLSFAIQNMKCDIKKMFEYSINTSPVIATFLFPFFMVHAVKGSEKIELSQSNKCLETLCNKLSSLTNQITIEILNQFFLLIQCPYAPLFFLSSKKRDNTSILMYVVVYVVKAFESNQDEINKLIINFFYLLQYIQYENEKTIYNSDEEPYCKSITFSILATLFYSLRSSNYLTNSIIIILFGLSFGEFLLSQLNYFSKYANFFVKELFKFVLKAFLMNEKLSPSSNEYQSVITQLIKFISFLTSKPKFVFVDKMLKLISIIDGMAKKNKKNSFKNIFFSNHSNESNEQQQIQMKTKTFIFQRNKYYVKAPIQSLPSSFEQKNFDEKKSVDGEIQRWNWSDFIEGCLDYYNSMKSDVIDLYFEEELNDNIYETLKNIFYSLQIPSSHIYDSCPNKYTISDTSNKIEIRRLLFPLNPSYDSCFLSYWDTKYQKEKPKIRLTINDIIRPNMFSISQTTKNAKIFKAAWLYRISMIKGFIILTDQRIKFYTKKLDDILITFSIKDIKNVRLMFNQHEKKGILLEDNLYRNYSFAFKTESSCEEFMDLLSRRLKIPPNRDIEKLLEKQKKWHLNEISNFEYLIYLNKFSGRTWCDFTQYPFFPWVLTKFDSFTRTKPQKKIEGGLKKLNLHDLSIYRDLKYQLFAQTEAHRKCCNDYYEVTSELNNGGSHFPNYVSNIGSTIYYLVRLEPFITEEILFQSGKYDSPDRMFQSFDITSQIMFGVNTKSSLEFVPEIYYLPEMYKNINNLVFPKSNIDSSIDLENFSLPRWAKNAEDLVYKLRKALESPYVSTYLNEWIDLIWGVKRHGDLAVKNTNVFPSHVYKFDKESCNGDKILIRGILSEIHSCGTAPEQLFFEPHPQRLVPVVDQATKEQSSPKGNKNISSSKSLTFLTNKNVNVEETTGEKNITKYSSSFNLQNSKTLNDDRQNFDINSHFTFFEQRESRLQFTDIRPPMARESYSLKFDKDWLIIPPIHKIRINRKGVVEIVRRNSIAPATKYRFGQSITPLHIAKSGSDIVTAHKASLIAHWSLSSELNKSYKIQSSNSTSNLTKSTQKVSSSPSILSSLSSNSNFNLNLSAASSSTLSNSNKKPNLTITSSSSIASSSVNTNKSPKKVTIETEQSSTGETCLKLVRVLSGYPVAISCVFISTASFVILAGHEDGCVSVFSISPHRFLRVIQIEDDKKERVKFPVTMVRTSSWNSDIIVFQEKNFEENDRKSDIITAKTTDKVDLIQMKEKAENSSMMNKLMTTVKSKFQRGNVKKEESVTANDNKSVPENDDAENDDDDDFSEKNIVDASEVNSKYGVLTVISLYSINGVFFHRVCLNHKIVECCGTSYPYATKKNYFALLTCDAKIILLNGRNLHVSQVYDISACPPAVSIFYNRYNDTLIMTTKTKEVVNFSLVPFSSSSK